MLELALVFLVGAMIGSFCNVVIYRLPRGESIITPRSHCTSCGNYIYPWDNIPLLSYLMLKGRCRFCDEYISLRYPAVEFSIGLLCALLYEKFGFNIDFLIYSVLMIVLIVISLIDYDFMIIPDKITIPGIIVGMIISYFVYSGKFFDSLIGVLIGGFIFYMIAIISKGGMGGGDIKLISMIGAFIGWQGVLFTIFAGAMLGSIVGVTLIFAGRKGRHDRVPFGPFLSAGAILFIFFGDDLLNYYVNYLL